MSDPIMSVVIHSRAGLIFEGPAVAVSSTNKIGPFDVLPLHANFVTVVEKHIVVELPSGIKKLFDIPRGILKNKQNKVEIYVGI